MKEIDFDKDVLARSEDIPVVVDFWAPWCGPCLLLEPIITELALENSHQWQLVKIKVDEEPALREKYHIMGVPAIRIFYKGKIIGQYNGLMWKKDLERWIAQQMPDEATE